MISGRGWRGWRGSRELGRQALGLAVLGFDSGGDSEGGREGKGGSEGSFLEEKHDGERQRV